MATKTAKAKKAETPAKKKKSGKYSRDKGARFERTLASKFRDYGYDNARRTAQYCGNTGDASDVVGLPFLHIEAKAQETMRLYDWIAQAKNDAEANGRGELPAVFHKKNNCNILVTMELEAFMQIYTEYEAGRSLAQLEEAAETAEDTETQSAGA
jgi:Holliday junction resolvase